MNIFIELLKYFRLVTAMQPPVVPAMHNLTRQLRRRNMNIKNNGTEKRRLIEWQSTTKRRSETKGGEKKKKKQSPMMRDDAVVLNFLTCQP